MKVENLSLERKLLLTILILSVIFWSIFGYYMFNMSNDVRQISSNIEIIKTQLEIDFIEIEYTE